MSELSDLKGVELFLSAMQEHVQDGIVITDHDLKILDINPAAETMLGYVAGEAIGRPAADILISSETLLPSLESAVQKNTVHQIGERKLHKRDGFEFLASLRAIPLEQGEGRPRLLILISDLSEHEAVHLQNQQLQQRAAIGEVTAIFAHEVRNPINSISTGLQLIQMNLQEDDPLKDQIRTIQGDVDRLEHRMKAVDSFSRNLDPHPEALDLGEFCRNQLDRWRPRMNRKNIKDHIQIASGTHLVLADRRALDQVLTNLITNAIQAMEEQESGILAIRVRPSPDDPKFVDLHISDSGPGIPEDIRKRIFEPFFTTKGNEGTGLGLAISKRIIMAHHGKIECDSFPGGTLFKIQLPVAPQTDLEGSLPNGS
jgi:PAS domain S-box-containing protein